MARAPKSAGLFFPGFPLVPGNRENPRSQTSLIPPIPTAPLPTPDFPGSRATGEPPDHGLFRPRSSQTPSIPLGFPRELGRRRRPRITAISTAAPKTPRQLAPDSPWYRVTRKTPNHGHPRPHPSQTPQSPPQIPLGAGLPGNSQITEIPYLAHGELPPSRSDSPWTSPISPIKLNQDLQLTQQRLHRRR